MASMTEEQAVAWLLLEGYAVGISRDSLRWVKSGGANSVPTSFDGNPPHMGRTPWALEEFVDNTWEGKLGNLYDYKRYAPAVVKLLTEKENES